MRPLKIATILQLPSQLYFSLQYVVTIWHTRYANPDSGLWASMLTTGLHHLAEVAREGTALREQAAWEGRLGFLVDKVGRGLQAGTRSWSKAWRHKPAWRTGGLLRALCAWWGESGGRGESRSWSGLWTRAPPEFGAACT